MSFIVRQISRTADGREIIRPTTYDKAALTIGRDAASDIHLADLAVELSHATMAMGANGRVAVNAVSDLGFDADGRTTTSAEIDPARGGELRFGSHRLTVGSDGGNVLVSVERIEALSDASEAKDEIGLFTLKGLLPGRRVSAWGFIGLVLAAFLIWPIYSYATSRGEKIRSDSYHGDEAWISGSLSEGHASLAKDCQACHVDAFVAVRDDACMACHTGSHQDGTGALRPARLTRGDTRVGPAAYDHAPSEMMLASKAEPSFGGRITGVFKAAFNLPAGRCVECHTEHEGAGPMPATAQAFCSDCHTGLDGRLKQAGFKSEIGSASDFGLQHPEFRPSILSGFANNQNIPFERRNVRLGGDPMLGWNVTRVSLARPQKQDGGLKFTHGQHLSSTNGVAQMWSRVNPNARGPMACEDCHRADANGTRFVPVDMETSCQSCHSLGIQTVGGIVRQLPHGQPEQVVADIRAFYGQGGAYQPVMGPAAQYLRRRPGEINTQRRAEDASRAAALRPRLPGNMIQATFSKDGVCGECHNVQFGTPGPAGVRIMPVAQPTRYFRHGWFDHKPHIGLDFRDAKGTSRDWGCADCHAANASNDANDLLLPAMATCKACHTGENGATNAKLVRTGTPSSCAMCHDYHIDNGAPWRAKGEQDRTKAQRPRRVASRN